MERGCSENTTKSVLIQKEPMFHFLLLSTLMTYKVKIWPLKSDSFFDLINNALLCISRGPRKFLIMDNANIHKMADSKELCTNKDYIPKYLLPYTHQLNPIVLTNK